MMDLCLLQKSLSNLPFEKNKNKIRRKEKMNLSKKGELVALDRQICWTKLH